MRGQKRQAHSKARYERTREAGQPWARYEGKWEAGPIYGQGMRGSGRQAPSIGKVCGDVGGRPHLWARYERTREAGPIYGQGMRGCGRQAPFMGKV